MTYYKIIQVLHKYINILTAHIEEQDSVCKLCHVKWMCRQAMTFLPGKADKANRWLGFIQGALWCEEVFSIEEMQEDNNTLNYLPKTLRKPKKLPPLRFPTWSSR